MESSSEFARADPIVTHLRASCAIWVTHGRCTYPWCRKNQPSHPGGGTYSRALRNGACSTSSAGSGASTFFSDGSQSSTTGSSGTVVAVLSGRRCHDATEAPSDELVAGVYDSLTDATVTAEPVVGHHGRQPWREHRPAAGGRRSGDPGPDHGQHAAALATADRHAVGLRGGARGDPAVYGKRRRAGPTAPARRGVAGDRQGADAVAATRSLPVFSSACLSQASWPFRTDRGF